MALDGEQFSFDELTGIKCPNCEEISYGGKCLYCGYKESGIDEDAPIELYLKQVGDVKSKVSAITNLRSLSGDTSGEIVIELPGVDIKTRIKYRITLGRKNSFLPDEIIPIDKIEFVLPKNSSSLVREACKENKEAIEDIIRIAFYEE